MSPPRTVQSETAGEHPYTDGVSHGRGKNAQKNMQQVVHETVAQLGMTSGNMTNLQPGESNRQRYGNVPFGRPRFSQPSGQGKCKYCGSRGHFWRECRKRLRAQSPRWPQNSLAWTNTQAGQRPPWQFPTPATGQQSGFVQYGRAPQMLMIAPPTTGCSASPQQSQDTSEIFLHPHGCAVPMA